MAPASARTWLLFYEIYENRPAASRPQVRFRNRRSLPVNDFLEGDSRLRRDRTSDSPGGDPALDVLSPPRQAADLVPDHAFDKLRQIGVEPDLKMFGDGVAHDLLQRPLSADDGLGAF